MELYKKICTDNAEIYTDPAKYYLIYTQGNPEGDTNAFYKNYISIFKGNGNHNWYSELYVLGYDVDGEFFERDFNHDHLDEHEAYYDYDRVYELTDSEVETHIVIACI